jgi:hypothetical protein
LLRRCILRANLQRSCACMHSCGSPNAPPTHLAFLKALRTNWKPSTVIHRDPGTQDTARMVAQKQRRARVEAVACHIALLEHSSNVRALTGDILCLRERFTACVCVCVVCMYTYKYVCVSTYTRCSRCMQRCRVKRNLLIWKRNLFLGETGLFLGGKTYLYSKKTWQMTRTQQP